MTLIGQSVRRTDGESKVRGEAVYGVDYAEPHMLIARVVRSTVAHGRIVRIDTSAAESLPGVHAVATGADADGCFGWILKDKPVLARDVVRYIGEPVAAVAAETFEQAQAAARAVVVEIEELPAVFDVEAAIADGAPVLHPDRASYAAMMPAEHVGNVAWISTMTSGDVEAAFARDDVVIVEDEFRSARQHQAYIEPRAAVARYANGRYEIHSTNQFPFLVRDGVAEALGVSPSRVRVIATTVGGGFGGKLEAGPEPVAALLARKSGRPVKLQYSRREEFTAATPRENGIVRIRTAVTRDGTLVAQQATMLMDNGAYSGETVALGAVPGLILPGVYRLETVSYTSKVVYTNTPPTGAYRGVCGPYLVFAAERHLDHIANELGIDRRELRLKNLWNEGDTWPNGQAIVEADSMRDAFARVEEVAPWAELSERRPNRGVGIAAVNWLTNPMPGGATIKLNEDGTVGLVTGATEIGTGAVAAGLVQIVAEELSIRPEDVVVLPPDTDASGYDSGAQGSRTLFNVGNAIALAAGEVRRQVFETASMLMEAAADDLELIEGHVQVKGSPDRRQPLAFIAQMALWTGGPILGSGKYVSPPIPFDQGCVTGALFTTLNASQCHVHLAEVEVDPDTGKVTILRYVVAQDVGRAINPTMIRGQIQGSVAQGIGYALYENVRFADGRPVEQGFETYRLPTASDVPPIETMVLEYPAAHGPYGAKGAAEPAIVPVAAALVNAIADATGKPFSSLPVTPFDILAALRDGAPVPA